MTAQIEKITEGYTAKIIMPLGEVVLSIHTTKSLEWMRNSLLNLDRCKFEEIKESTKIKCDVKIKGKKAVLFIEFTDGLKKKTHLDQTFDKNRPMEIDVAVKCESIKKLSEKQENTLSKYLWNVWFEGKIEGLLKNAPHYTTES